MSNHSSHNTKIYHKYYFAYHKSWFPCIRWNAFPWHVCIKVLLSHIQRFRG